MDEGLARRPRWVRRTRKAIEELAEWLEDLVEDDDDLRFIRSDLEGLLHLIQSILGPSPAPPPPAPAVGIRIHLGGNSVTTTTVSVDVTNELVVANWIDDKGDVTTAPNGPDGNPASIAYSSSDESVVTVDSAGNLVFLAVGTATLTASPVDSTGAPLDGFTAATADLVITPGAAVGLEVSVEGAPPVPAPTPPPA